jgi:hypothetical protein
VTSGQLRSLRRGHGGQVSDPGRRGHSTSQVANGITTVHLSYLRERTGHALAGAEHWVPREQIEDPVASLGGRSAAKGSKGDRWYAWAWLSTASPRHWLHGHVLGC